MKITDFFPSSKSFANKGKERPVSTPAIDNAEQQVENMSLSGSIKIQTPRKKRERFSDPELHKLVDTVLEHIHQLYGFKKINASGKATIWDKVVKEVNKVGGTRRTAVECKKRWNDYKRKVKQMIDNWKSQSSMGGQMLPLSEIFSRRQIIIAQFFKMDASRGQKIEINDESLSDTGECASSNEPVLTASYTVDSEDEFNPSQNKSFSSMTLLSSTSHQDKFISQSYEEPQTTSTPCDPYNAEAVDASISPYTATEFQLQVGAQMVQLAAQQKNIFQALQSIQEGVTASLNIQNNMHNLVTGSFLELQKTLLSSQKASSDHSNIVELRLSSLQTKLDEMNSVLRVKQLQEIISTDGLGLGSSGTHDIRPTPTATYTPAATCAPKVSTPARKRAVDQSPSASGLMKKMKKI